MIGELDLIPSTTMIIYSEKEAGRAREVSRNYDDE